MKSVLLVGLGRFGRTMAMRMCELKNEVMAVDIDEERVNEMMPYVTNAQIGDSTNEQFIASLGVRNFDVCVVAIGDNFQSSLETTSLLKECGAKFVVARANRDVHAKFLLRNGADQVVYVEKEMALRCAMKYSCENLFDYIELTPEYSIYEIATPREWVGKTIMQIDVRNKYHLSILATKQEGQVAPQPQAEYTFTGKETLIVMGKNKEVRKFLI